MSTVWLSGCVSLDLDSNLLRNKSKCYRKKKKFTKISALLAVPSQAPGYPVLQIGEIGME
jgi:hypothetical protein